MSYEEVVLSNGDKAAVGKIRWGAYKQLRGIVARAISGDVASVVRALIACWEEFEKADLKNVKSFEEIKGAFNFDNLQKVLSGVETVNDLLIEAWPVIILGCVKATSGFDEISIENLPAEDFLALGRVAVQKAEIPNLIAIEGNSLAAALTAATPTA